MKTTLLKKGLLIVTLLFASLINSQNVNIPDYEFKQALLNYSPSIDTNNDNQISVQEAAVITTLNISGYQSVEDIGGACPDPNDPNCGGGGGGGIITSYGIADFTGIEAFTSLTSLTCNSNELTSLNVSALINLTYLDCSNNQNPNVTMVYYPGISTLILPSSGSLETLHSGYNDLGTLDVSIQTSLKTLKTSFNHINTLTLPNTNSLTYLDTSRNQLTTLDLSIYTNLTDIVCDNNNINTLTLPNTNTLTYLNCQRNQITTLDASPYTSLISLICDNNSINSFTLPNTNTLTTLKCFLNQIPSLDISNNAGLTLLDCRNNPLINLNLLQNTVLETLNCSGTQLTDLDVTNNTLLSTIACGGNQITSLDLSRQTNLHTFYGNNNLLTSLNIKNGNNNAINNSRFNVLNNPNLGLICVDNLAYANSTFTNKDGQSFYSDICSFIPTNSNTITGIVSFDFDANGCDAADTKSINTKLTNIGTSTSNVTFTDTNGQYIMYTQEATNTTTINLNLPSFFTVTPTTQSTTFTGSGNTETIDFCITANQVVNDVKVTVIPTFEARPGFDTSARVYYENVGSSILSGTVDLAFEDSKLSFITASATPDSQTNTLLSWNYTNLLPFENGFIDVHFNINTPTDSVNPVNGGDTITYTSTVTCTDTDADLNNNTSTTTEPVVNSYDPNDIICFEGDYIDAVEVPNFLNYRVRFQNTGTASAINIVVKNELDTDLDWDTFTPISASHNYRPTLTDGNKLEFIFENIYLADSNSDEPASHGWVYFKIKSKSTFSLSDIAENTSYIYFDYNAPIITNTATTQLSNIATLSTVAANNITLTDATLNGTVSANNGAIVTERGFVYAETSNNANPQIGGTAVVKISNGTGLGTFNTPLTNLTASTSYSFKSYAINAAGTNYGNTETFTTDATASITDEFLNNNLSIQPNPVKEMLRINTTQQIKIQEVEIYTLLGKQILKESNIKTINVSELSRGIYILKIKTDKGVGIKKIIKE
jgi:Leucine-rich repeat (LRR) protein